MNVLAASHLFITKIDVITLKLCSWAYSPASTGFFALRSSWCSDSQDPSSAFPLSYIGGVVVIG